jgi:hypothetical protein
MTWMVTVQPPERRHCLIDEWNQITDKAEKERWLVEQYQDAMQSGVLSEAKRLKLRP